MTPDRIFAIVLGLIFTVFTMIRRYYNRQRQDREKLSRVSLDQRLLRAIILYQMITLGAYFVLAHLEIGIPLMLPLRNQWRWGGVGLATLALLLLGWSHHCLGTNYSQTMQIYHDHTLVQSGPYQVIRHPIYTSLLLLQVAVWLITANWGIGITWLGSLIGLIAYRIPREEALLQAQFPIYTQYATQTGRFLPSSFSFHTKDPDKQNNNQKN